MFRNHVDLGDFAVHDLDFEHEKQLTARSHDSAHRSVDEYRPCALCPTHESFGHIMRTMNDRPCGDRRKCRVVPEYDIGV